VVAALRGRSRQFIVHWHPTQVRTGALFGHLPFDDGSADDTATGSGTALSLDRLPPGKTVTKVYVQTAGTDSRFGVIQELPPGDPNAVWVAQGSAIPALS
jgi:hypothetical protein